MKHPFVVHLLAISTVAFLLVGVLFHALHEAHADRQLFDAEQKAKRVAVVSRDCRIQFPRSPLNYANCVSKAL